MNDPLAYLDEPFPPIPRWMYVVGGVIGAYLLSLIASAIIAADRGMAIVNAIFFGWLSFLLDRLGRAQPDWPSMLMGLAAFLMLMVLVHTIGHRAAMGFGDAGRWTSRSTRAVTLCVFVLFAGSVAMVGAAHQAIWLSREATSESTLGGSSTWPAAPGPLDLVQQARLAALRTQSRNNLKQIMLAMHNVHDNIGAFPAGVISDDRGHTIHGWVFGLSGFASFYVPTDWKKEPWNGPTNQKYAKGALWEFVNPQLGWHGQFDEHGDAYMHYAANVHGFPNNRGLKMSEITDGTSNTLAIGEVAENFQPWASPWNRRDPADGINDVPYGFGGPPSQNGAIFAFFDGQVRMISRNVDRDLLKSLGLPNDGQPDKEWESRLR